MSGVEAKELLPPARVVASRFRVESVIGEGAQSVVYLARRVAEGDAVALKVIHRHLSGDPRIAKRFHREARILRKLEGEHIVKLLDFVEDDGLLVIALEHIEGSTLEAMLAERAPLEIDTAIEIALQICAALGVAHANGIIHRDLKPANVLIERGVAGLRVKVVDFGLGKVFHGEQLSTGLTEQGMIFGTPEYMAPEIARGDELGAGVDLYAAGVMLYEMVAGVVPFQRRSLMGTIAAHLGEAPVPPRKMRPDAPITPSLEAVILRALAKSPSDRHGSARELAQAIAAARDDRTVVGKSSGADSVDLATGDTDLEMGQAVTLRADEVASMVGSDRPAVVVRRPEEDLRAKWAAISEEPTAVSGQPVPMRSAYLWTIVAVVAALLGVAIGVFVGVR